MDEVDFEQRSERFARSRWSKAQGGLIDTGRRFVELSAARLRGLAHARWLRWREDQGTLLLLIDQEEGKAHLSASDLAPKALLEALPELRRWCGQLGLSSLTWLVPAAGEYLRLAQEAGFGRPQSRSYVYRRDR